LDTDPREGVRKYGKVKFADPTNRKYPIDRPGHIKAAWAYIHQHANAPKYRPTKSGQSRFAFDGQRRREA
jgi:hypothetical protein